MRRKLLTTFIFALSLAACGPAMEPASSPPNILNLDGNSEEAPNTLDNLFDAQETVSTEDSEDQNDTSGDTFGPSGEETNFIGGGPAPDEVIAEPVTGPTPVDLAAEEAAVNSGASTPPQPTPSGQEEIREEPPVSPSTPQEEPSQAETEPPQLAEDQAAAEDPAEDVDQAVAPEDQNPEQDQQEQNEDQAITSTFSNPDAEKVFLQTVANSSIPFRRSNSLKLFWGRFDSFLDSRYLHQVGPEQREVFKIPRCSGTAAHPLQSRWPNFGPHLSMPPIVPVYVEQIGGVVDINAPLALLDRELALLNRGEDFSFPYYDVLETASSHTPGKDPILDHFVDNRGDLSYLALAASKEIFQRAMFHAAQMRTDSLASLELARECLTGGEETISCPEYRQSFRIHQKAQTLQRLALALASASQEGTCETWLNSAEQLGERSECLFGQTLSHDPKLWDLKTYYNPLRNLMRKSSDIDHWQKPEALTSEETQALIALLNQVLAAKPAQQRWAALLALRQRALNIYKNITLLFPSLRFVSSAQLDEAEFVESLQAVRKELNDIDLTYDGFKNLRLFPLAVLSRLESEAPVEMCDIAEEVISTWQPDSPLSSLLAVDQSFLFLPLEFHRTIPLETLTSTSFEGPGWEHIGQTVYDFAETRGWAFLASVADDSIRVSDVEVIQAAGAALRAKGEEPADQTSVWLQNSSESLLNQLLIE